MIEIAKGNQKFEKYLDHNLFTCLYNIYELYYTLLKDFNEKIAREFFYQFKKIAVQIKDEHIFEASRFKLKNYIKKFSYADCLGYAIALDFGIKFLTGDKEFQDLDNVEFIEK